MKRMMGWALVAALAGSGMASGLRAQADPFVTAQYDITIKHNADALAIVPRGAGELPAGAEVVLEPV